MLVHLLAIVMLCARAAGSGEEIRRFDRQLQELKLRSVLVVRSQAIDDYPLWSPDGEHLGVSVDGKWVKVDLNSLSLSKGTWHGGEAIGVATPQATLIALPKATLLEWRKGTKWDPRQVVATNGTKVELRSRDLGTEFLLTKDGEPTVLWRTSLENCHSLALSPDERYVAFICELNGIVVTLL